MGITDDLKKAFFEGYEAGKKDAEFYMLNCGDTDEPFTNADRIRNMSDEKLAKYCAWLEDPQACYIWEDYDNQDCISQWLDWLKEKVK